MPDFLHDFAGLSGPIPWIYCRAITTRLLVGMLTPAMRATALNSCCRPAKWRPGPGSSLRDQSANDNATPSPSPGARHRLRLLRLDARLIRGFNGVSSTSAGVWTCAWQPCRGRGTAPWRRPCWPPRTGPRPCLRPCGFGLAFGPGFRPFWPCFSRSGRALRPWAWPAVAALRRPLRPSARAPWEPPWLSPWGLGGAASSARSIAPPPPRSGPCRRPSSGCPASGNSRPAARSAR